MSAAFDMSDDTAWMQVFGGKKFFFLAPSAFDIRITDIAHSLAMRCRFNGHVKHFYSVAEHSVHVSHQVPAQYAMAALLHDAAEAYIGDMVSPLKNEMPQFRTIEHRIDAAVRRRFNVAIYDEKQDAAIKRADLALCLHEGRTLLPNPALVDEWGFAGNPEYRLKQPCRLYCHSPEVAEVVFLQRFDELGRDANKD